MLVFFVNLASAMPHAGVDYQIFDDKALVKINFGAVENLEFKLPYDARTIEVNTNFYEISDFENHKILKIAASDNLVVSYITNSVIEQSKKSYFFILKNPFEGSVYLQLFLPEGGILKEDGLLFPDPDSVTTDGRRIILDWSNFTSDEVVVAYEIPKKANIFWIILISVVLVVVIVYQSVVLKRRMKKLKKKKKISRKRQKTRAKKAITRNLFGEEKKIVEYLLGRKKRESWTKEIVRDLGISKVRLSRRLRSLQQKELIEKIPYGNENRIRLLKIR
jgi:uncharacterized membrane protein